MKLINLNRLAKLVATAASQWLSGPVHRVFGADHYVTAVYRDQGDERESGTKQRP